MMYRLSISKDWLILGMPTKQTLVMKSVHVGLSLKLKYDRSKLHPIINRSREKKASYIVIWWWYLYLWLLSYGTINASIIMIVVTIISWSSWLLTKFISMILLIMHHSVNNEHLTPLERIWERPGWLASLIYITGGLVYRQSKPFSR